MRLNELRRHDPAPISGKDCLLIEQISMYDDVPRFTAQVSALCDELEVRVKEGKGVAATGAPAPDPIKYLMALPNWKVPHVMKPAVR